MNANKIDGSVLEEILLPRAQPTPGAGGAGRIHGLAVVRALVDARIRKSKVWARLAVEAAEQERAYLAGEQP